MTQRHATPPNKTPLSHALYLRGIVAKDFAEQIGVDPSSFSRWRNGLKPPKSARKKIARALRMKEADLWPEHEGANA